MLFLAPRLSTRPSPLCSRFRPIAPSWPPKQQQVIIILPLSLHQAAHQPELELTLEAVGPSWSPLSQHRQDHLAPEQEDSHHSVSPAVFPWPSWAGPQRELLQNDGVPEYAVRNRETHCCWHFKSVNSSRFNAFVWPTFSPKSLGRWCGCWSCDCELHSARPSLAPPPRHQQLSHSNLPSRCRRKCCSCSPDKKKNHSDKKKDKPTSTKNLFGSTEMINLFFCKLYSGRFQIQTKKTKYKNKK